MIDVLKEVTKEFRLVTPEAYYRNNTKKTIQFPYLTFTLDNEDLEVAEGFYLDVDIFDSNRTSYLNLFTLEDQLKAHFKDKDVLTSDLFIRFNFVRSHDIDMLDDLLKRRNLQFYCKVYRRG